MEDKQESTETEVAVVSNQNAENNESTELAQSEASQEIETEELISNAKGEQSTSDEEEAGRKRHRRRRSNQQRNGRRDNNGRQGQGRRSQGRGHSQQGSSRDDSFGNSKDYAPRSTTADGLYRQPMSGGQKWSYRQRPQQRSQQRFQPSEKDGVLSVRQPGWKEQINRSEESNNLHNAGILTIRQQGTHTHELRWQEKEKSLRGSQGGDSQGRRGRHRSDQNRSQQNNDQRRRNQRRRDQRNNSNSK